MRRPQPSDCPAVSPQVLALPGSSQGTEGILVHAGPARVGATTLSNYARDGFPRNPRSPLAWLAPLLRAAYPNPLSTLEAAPLLPTACYRGLVRRGIRLPTPRRPLCPEAGPGSLGRQSRVRFPEQYSSNQHAAPCVHRKPTTLASRLSAYATTRDIARGFERVAGLPPRGPAHQ